ncbi:MAG: hypothetical protein IT209_03720 [Armatimonadetes bacterium]|nr:hypothetical protein [Armatimonadota bacterium]
MVSLYQWVSNMLGLVAFLVTMFICVTGGQDLLTCALKSIGAGVVVRLIGNLLAGVVDGLERSGTFGQGAQEDK